VRKGKFTEDQAQPASAAWQFSPFLRGGAAISQVLVDDNRY
jgi:hypothetical protein